MLMQSGLENGGWISQKRKSVCLCVCVRNGVVVNLIFLAMLPPDMVRIAIRVLGQCQKHGASLADDIVKWGFAQFFSVDPFSEAARNMSLETIGQGEDGSSHFVVAGSHIRCSPCGPFWAILPSP
jgi:hypothetical protein